MGEGNPTAKPHATKDCSGVRKVVGGAGSCMDCRLHHFSDSSQTSGVYNLVGQSVANEPTSVERALVETVSNWTL